VHNERRAGRLCIAILGIAILVAAVSTGCAELPQITITLPAAPTDAPTGPPAPATGDAAAALAALPVKGRAPKTGYDRDQFGRRWADIDRNGCDQRNDVLARDLTEGTYEAGTRDCVMLTGVLVDPYTGRTMPFTRGEDTSDDVQIDHVVALSNAWQTGAQQLDGAARELFANDPLNLLAVEGAVNGSKGDGDAATWLPPDRGYWCRYVARQVAVKATYGLWVTPPERDAITRVLGGCPGEPLPAPAA